MSILQTFNDQVKLLLGELGQLFPEEKKIPVFQSQLDVALLLDDKIAYGSFLKFVYPHKKEIMAENEDFFLDKSKDLENDFMVKTIGMKHLWENKLTLENKKIVWKYFKVLCLLADKMR